MDKSNDFFTLKGYARMEKSQITSAMEDYLEMIYRMHQEKRDLRITALAEALNVKPSSASRMVTNLARQELVSFEKYGIISLTEKGASLGGYLLFRHEILHRFFCYLNHSSCELEQVEKVEHFLDSQTIWNMKLFLEKHQNEH